MTPPPPEGPATFEQVALAFASLDPDRIKPGLERTREALALLGDPHTSAGIRWCIVAGTNGKGSTAAFLDSICRAAGHHTALYTSPHLERVTERLRMDGAEIGGDDFARIGARVLAVIERGPQLSFFEALTVTAFLWFAERRPAIGVLEVGLGGRWDATNVVEPAVSVLTTIGLDHTDWLGNDLVTIAREKAGVVRAGGVVVSGLPDDLHSAAVVPALAEGRAVRPGRDVHGALSSGRFAYRGLGLQIDDVALGVPGLWQQHNATLAAAAAELMVPGLRGADLARGLTDARWPGRYERVPGTDPAVYLDGAHNEQGAAALALTLLQDPPPGRVVLVSACRRDKDPASILAPLWPHLWAAVLTWVPGPRSRPPDELRAGVPGPLPGGIVEAENPAAALAAARALARPGDTILVAGSLYLAGAVRSLLVP